MLRIGPNIGLPDVLRSLGADPIKVIAEVGISMMLGGNAKGFTRTMTTAMALEYDKGEFVLAVALGIVLMLFAFTINLMFHFLQGRLPSDAL